MVRIPRLNKINEKINKIEATKTRTTKIFSSREGLILGTNKYS